MNNFDFKVALLRKGISQNQLSLRLNISPQALSNYLCGYRETPEGLREKIANELGVSVSDLFNGKERPVDDALAS